jgi:hypothetical protein
MHRREPPESGSRPAARPEAAGTAGSDPYAAQVLALQRSVGNAAVTRLLARRADGGAVLQRRTVNINGVPRETRDLTRWEIYALVAELRASPKDHPAAKELLDALHEGDYDDDDLDEEYEPSDDDTDEDALLSERDLTMPAEAYVRYAEHWDDTREEREKKATGKRSRAGASLKKGSLRQNTTAIAVIEEPASSDEEDEGNEREEETAGSEEKEEVANQAMPDAAEVADLAMPDAAAPDTFPVTRTMLLGQRKYPGMDDLAKENLASLEIASRASIPNIHAEMYALYIVMRRLVEDGAAVRLLEIQPSNPVCFFCEVMLRLFNVEYDHAYVSKKVHPKWKEPSGHIEYEETALTPRAMLERFGMDVNEAVARIRPLFEDVEDRVGVAFANRILDGRLHGRDLGALIKDLKLASATIAEANRATRGRGNQRRRAKQRKAAAAESPTPEASGSATIPAAEVQSLEQGQEAEEGEPDADPIGIPNVGNLVNVAGADNNCLIEAVLEQSGIDFDANVIREHLVKQNVADFKDMLDLAGIAGGVMLSFLAEQNRQFAARGLIVHYWAQPGVLGQRVVVEGPNPIHLWLSHNHFQAVKPA